MTGNLTTDTAPVHLPAAKEIRDLLEGLVGRDVKVAPTTPLAPGPYAPCSVAVYVDDLLRISAVIACDAALSAWAAAAIGLVPAKRADEVRLAGALTPELAENLSEVLNVAAALFNVPGAAHLRLHALHPAGPALPADALARSLALGRRIDLQVEIAGYGAGTLAVVLS
ncbi:MAG TPA: hypothetical protein VGE77_06105 [Nocardioides sp.]